MEALVKVAVGEYGQSDPFFRHAYLTARQSASERVLDEERLRGCVLRIMIDQRLNGASPEDRAKAQFLLSAALTLGLAEASEGNLNTAVAILRGKEIHQIAAAGLLLHQEVRDEAARIVKRAQVTTSKGHRFNLLDRGEMQKLNAMEQGALLYPTRQTYAEARTALEHARLVCRLATQIPIVYALEHEEYLWCHRAKKLEPAAVKLNWEWGLTGYFLRSFLLAAMVQPYQMPSIYRIVSGLDPKYFSGFMTRNFNVPDEPFCEFIQDAFFEPVSVEPKIKKALEALERFLKLDFTIVSTSKSGYSEEDVFRVKPLPAEDVKAAMRYAVGLLEGFSRRVHEFFVQAAEAEVTAEAIERYWLPHIIINPFKLRALVLRQPALGDDRKSLIRLPWLDFIQFLEFKRERSPSELDQLFEEYPWRKFVDDNSGIETRVRTLAVAVRVFGTRVLAKVVDRKNPEFWVDAWEYGSEELRSAILEATQKDDLPLHNLADFAEVVNIRVFSSDRDLRYLECLIAKSRIDEAGSISSGVSLNAWGHLLHVFMFFNEQALRRIWELIPSDSRGEVIKMFTNDDRQKIRNVTGDTSITLKS